jgi:hypothetical protein
MRVPQIYESMPVKSTPAKSTSTRRTRSRKTSTTKAQSLKQVNNKEIKSPTKVNTTASKIKTVKKQTPVKSVKVVVNQEDTKRPQVELISVESYLQDINKRWQIHTFETKQLVRDLNKVVNYLTPHFDSFVKRIESLV